MTSSSDGPDPGVVSAAGANRTRALAKYRTIVREHMAAQQRILADQKWTAQAKRDELSRLHQIVLNRREELRRAHYAELADRRAELHQEAFGPRRPADLPAWRTAATAATSLEDEARALVSLAVARKAGDELWARALGATAVERGWPKVLEAYTAAYPDARQAVEALAEADWLAARVEDDFAFAAPTMSTVPDRGPAEIEAQRRGRGYTPMMPAGTRVGDISR
jgi:hypothetical protein